MKPSKSAAEILKRPYSRILIPEAEGGFSAEILEFPGCFAEGETAHEAVQNLEAAALSWVEAAQAQGLSIPEPTGAQEDASGRFVLRVPRALHQRAVRLARRDGVSLNQFVVAALAERVGGEDLVARLERRFDLLFGRLERSLRFERRGSNEPGAVRHEVIAPNQIAQNEGVQLH